MGHPRWPGFQTDTGNPAMDNANRNLNRRIWRETKTRIRFKSTKGRISRKRLKHLKRVEGGRYIEVICAAMNMLARRNRDAA